MRVFRKQRFQARFKRMRMRWLGVAAWLVLAMATVFAQDSAPLSLDDYKRTLQETQDTLSTPGRASLDRNFLPETWIVRDGKRESRVSTSWLRNGLKEMEDKPADADKIRASLLDKLKALRAESDSSGHQTSVDAERLRIAAILTRREFGKVHGP